jgi:hypothetical protein
VNANEAKAMIDWVAANWRQEITEDQAVPWYDFLSGREWRPVFIAVQELRLESSFVPDFRLLHERCEQINKRLSALGPGEAPRRCELCDGTGWMLTPVVGGVEAYARCRCQGKSEPEHKGGCTCLDCSYGERSKAIRTGVDGIRTPPDNDPLRPVPIPTFS